MKNLITILVVITITFSFSNKLNAQNMNKLDSKQQGIIPIAAFTAAGKLENLETALNDGLNAGLTINEIKEVLVQMYAYTGFPRSLNAITTFMGVLKAREQEGIKDVEGKEASPLPTDKSSLALGTDVQTFLVGAPVKGTLMDFVPAIDVFLKDHLFGDIFGRDNLDYKSREIATVAALSSLEGAEGQLRSHLNISMNIGITPEQLQEVIEILKIKVGKTESNRAQKELQIILTSKGINLPQSNIESDSNLISRSSSIFSKGDKVTTNFTGTAWVYMMTKDTENFDSQVYNVTFEPGCRNYWHSHPGGQILIVTSGKGYYQEEGKQMQLLAPGDVVEIRPNIVHWHGATPDSEFVHIGITTQYSKGPAKWLGPVTDEQYDYYNK